MRIRDATVSDAQKISQVHIDTWKTAYRGIVPQDYLDNLSYKEREERWTNILTNLEAVKSNKSFTLVAEVEDERLVGFASAGKERSQDPVYSGELYGIYILQDWQKKRIGTVLVKETVRRLINEGFCSMLVWVLADNPSRLFYESLGGKPIRTQLIKIGGADLKEVAYGWQRVSAILE